MLYSNVFTELDTAILKGLYFAYGETMTCPNRSLGFYAANHGLDVTNSFPRVVRMLNPSYGCAIFIWSKSRAFDPYYANRAIYQLILN
jgi:hypothetical protein